jgi:hypothetical protein
LKNDGGWQNLHKPNLLRDIMVQRFHCMVMTNSLCCLSPVNVRLLRARRQRETSSCSIQSIDKQANTFKLQ